MSELVSCILATRNRPHFLAQALRYFRHQTYPCTELIVIDDGETSVADLCGRQRGVRYIRLNRRTHTGSKLNIGVEHARGTILHKIDDDDYYSPDFLATSASQLPRLNRGRVLVARDCFLILFAAEARLRFSGHGWTAGGTFCFGRKLWERAPFRDVSGNADSCFLADHDPEIVPICAPEQYWLVRHGRNTWTMMSDGDTADGYMHTLKYYRRSIGSMLCKKDQAFYRALRRSNRDTLKSI
jgi:glycosyltransferase involved in cell wall biosynthesis